MHISLFDWAAALFFAAFLATFVVMIVEAYNDIPDWWK